MGKNKPYRHRWVVWMKRISEEMVKCAFDRYIFDRWWFIINENPDIDINNTFVTLIWSSYFQRQAMTARRQVKIDRNTISLVCLLNDIANDDTYITRDKFLSYHVNPDLEQTCYQRTYREASRFFDSFAGRGKPHISGERVRRDIQRLKQVALQLERYADKWIAHSDSKRRWPRLSFEKLNKTLDLLIGMWKRYHNIAAGGPVLMDPASMAGREWEKVLTIPWKPTSSS
jgi:hypothetical protein